MEELLSIGTNIATLIAIGVGVISTVIVAYSGFQYATAGGDPQKVGLAKNSFIGAFIGLIIASLAFIGPRTVTDMVIRPVGGIAVESGTGLNCDGILRNQLVFQRGASTSERMNIVIAQIQSQHSECDPEVWSPTAIAMDFSAGATSRGQCFGSTPGHPNTETDLASLVVGTHQLPLSLLTPGSTSGKYLPRRDSGRDSENNILVYFSDVEAERPSDGASCWLHYARLKQWPRISTRANRQICRWSSLGVT